MARPRSELRARILRAARDHFLRHGVDGASLRAIASGARTTIGMVYYYFPTKDELFLAVIEETYAGLLTALQEIVDGGGGVEQKLARTHARLWSMSDDEFATVRLVLREALVSAVRVRRISERFLRGHIPLFLGLLLEGRQGGVLRDDQPLVAQLMTIFSLAILPVLAFRVAFPAVRGKLQLPGGDELQAALQAVLLRGITTAGELGRPQRRARLLRTARGRAAPG